MKLFAELYLDEDVSALTAILLRGRGLNVVTALAEHTLGQDDAAQLAHAAALGRCIITHNRLDFEQLHRRAWQPVGSMPASSSQRDAHPTSWRHAS